MANRRMFNLKIIDTDDFLNMPASSRLLYYDLAMRADDDGFVNSPKKIMKIIGATDDDFKVLCAKQYLIPFENGICVIKDWKIHNYIQKDRYQPTMYNREMQQLRCDENGSYSKCIQNGYALDTECIQNVSKLDTQVRVRLELEKEKPLCDKSHDTGFDNQKSNLKISYNGKEIKKPDFEVYGEEFEFEDYENIWDISPPKMGKALDTMAEIALKHLNFTAKTRFRPVKVNLTMIKAILASGVTLHDIAAVNARLVKKWKNTEMEQYLRPKTIYAAKNFEQYLGDLAGNRLKRKKEG
jgi:uncharacterized phage protein (TIGR02220 family)